ncbi:MAG: N-acetyl-gamma-glutamyl-phosphate reductase [Clostridia bacterium]|nr:N-acetyl-gamma-glutamyl-phosphate reductase [Clostridia bacterium]
MADVFIDGSSGTTGLRIRERLSGRQDIRLLQLSEEKRHDVSARTEAISCADVAFLCLPDAAAAEIAEAARDCASVIIDTSTVHRTEEGWTYGFPELDGQRERIASSKRIANPGCHAGGFIALVRPLVFYGLISEDIRLQCTSLTGYSGGGKKMIADYSDAYDNRTAASSADGGAPRGESFGRLQAPRLYGLGGGHKHLPEMTKVCGLSREPLFLPVVSSFYSGMEVIVQIPKEETKACGADISAAYAEYYGRDGLVRAVDTGVAGDGDGTLSAASMRGKDTMEVSAADGKDRILLVSRFDNLGKGASGAAIQNMNIALGLDEKEGLVI